ncbi:unnamed protein product [Prorocentrum cordatum]|uniref:Uncharacterized protein n=1 Tax=Prorocentrum cordatum TaxID=2364126 RepID=A0ABN9W8K8_9DINO|nr:unnamed protein product [Polarella glacialis]
MADPLCCWEFRRFVPVLLYRWKQAKPSKVFQALRLDVAQLADALQMPVARRTFLSLRAEAERVKKGGQPTPPQSQPFISRPPYSVTTEALLMWLLYHSSSRKLESHRVRAQAMILALLCCFLSPEIHANMAWDDIWSDQVCACCDGDLGHATCAHFRAAPPRPRPGRDGNQDLVESMVKFAKLVPVCGASAEALRRLLQFISAAVYAGASVGASDNSCKQRPLRGRKRQLRTDEDYKHHVMVQLPKKRAIMGGSMALACDSDMRDESRGRDWLCQQVNEYLHSGWHQLASHGPLRRPMSLVEDAARLGNPKQETEVSSIWIPELQTGRFLPAQVLPDFRGSDTKARSKLKPRSVDLIRDRIRAFLEKKKAVANGRGTMTIKQARLANKYSLMATDNALRGGLGCSGLSEFKPSHVVGRLGPDEERYMVPLASLPAPLQAGACSRVQRSCVRNLTTGVRRLEVAWGKPRPSLHSVIDMGSIGFPAKMHLYFNPKKDRCIRGSLEMDPAHRRHDNQ